MISSMFPAAIDAEPGPSDLKRSPSGDYDVAS